MRELKIGDKLSTRDANEESVSGKVEKFLKNTVILVDQQLNRFLVKKEQIIELGFSCPEYKETDTRIHLLTWKEDRVLQPFEKIS